MQQAIVAVIVAVAAWAVMRRYAPSPLRKLCRTVLAKMAARLGWRGLENRLHAPAQAVDSCADGCGSCGGCRSVAPQPENRHAITPQDLKRTIRHY